MSWTKKVSGAGADYIENVLSQIPSKADQVMLRHMLDEIAKSEEIDVTILFDPETEVIRQSNDKELIEHALIQGWSAMELEKIGHLDWAYMDDLYNKPATPLNRSEVFDDDIPF